MCQRKEIFVVCVGVYVSCLPAGNPKPFINHHLCLNYSAGVGDCARGVSTGANVVLGDTVEASLSDSTSPSIPALAPAAVVPPFELAIGSGDSVRSIAISCPSRDSGARTPPRRKRGVVREPRRSAGGGGGSESSALLGIHERNVRGDRPSACEVVVIVVAVDGVGLDRLLGVVAAPAPETIPVPVLVLVLSGLQGNSGRRVGKNRRGGTHVVFGEKRDDIVVVVVDDAESSASGSGPGTTLLLPSRPDERRREVKSVKSTVRERAGSRRIDGWRVSGVADGAAVGDGGPHPSGEVSRRRTQSSRRVEERNI